MTPVWLAVAAILLPVCWTDSPPTVNTCEGPVVGKYVESRDGRKVEAFLGIPYAKPPVGQRRFEPPEPVDPRPGVLDATSRGPHCPQLFVTSYSEDCLYLDVYRPEGYVGAALPVMFWVYGGQYVFGASDFYNPTYFMDEDVIFVVINYRLGMMGFLSTGDEVIPGNMGLKDIRQALRWVQSNIRRFGGNPDRVTIFGESAGATAVHYMMAFLGDQGLFHGAICQSGVSLTPWALRPPDQVKDNVRALASLSFCPEDSKGLAECLKKKTVIELLALSSVPDFQGGLDPQPKQTPVVEPAGVKDRIVTDNPWRVNTDMPWIVGVNSAESLYYFTVEINDKTGMLFRLLDLTFDKKLLQYANYDYSSANGSTVPAGVRRLYLGGRPVSRATLLPTAQAASDVYFIYPAYEAVMRAKQRKTFFYYYDHIGTFTLTPILPFDRVGAVHADELFMFYPSPGLPQILPIKTPEVQLSKTLVKLWTNFATYLDPTPSCGDLDWRPFSDNQSYLTVTQTGLEMRTHFLPDRMKFWRDHPFPYRDDEF